jgi:hypothetical protein
MKPPDVIVSALSMIALGGLFKNFPYIFYQEKPPIPTNMSLPRGCADKVGSRAPNPSRPGLAHSLGHLA